MMVCGDSKRSENGGAYLCFQHARHCFCACGIRIHSRPFHWKMKSLSLGISLPSTVCTEWSDIDTALAAKDAQIFFSLERFFYPVAFQRWVKEGNSKFATDSASAALQDESLGAQNGPESDGNNLLPAGNHVSNGKQIAYPTEARERQKAREKRAKETSVTLNVHKRKKFVENHIGDCGDDISSIVKDIDTYHATAVNYDELSESSDEDDYVTIHIYPT